MTSPPELHLANDHLNIGHANSIKNLIFGYSVRYMEHGGWLVDVIVGHVIVAQSVHVSAPKSSAEVIAAVYTLIFVLLEMSCEDQSLFHRRPKEVVAHLDAQKKSLHIGFCNRVPCPVGSHL